MGEAHISFNLVDKPWIKARTLDGKSVELSLLEVFHTAHKLQALANDTPTQDFAILRLLIAVTQRSIVGLLDEFETPADAWGSLWEVSQFHTNRTDEYLMRWRHRFDLFDSEQPFLQVAGMRATNGTWKDTRPLVGVPNRPQLFTLRSLTGLRTLSFDDAARWLVCIQTFDSSGIRSGVIRSESVSENKSMPIGPGWAGYLGGIYLEGRNLFETIMLNLCLWYSPINEQEEFYDYDDDLPAWEQPQKTAMAESRVPNGFVDVFTWQARRILMLRDGNVITGVVLTNGDKIENYNKYRVEPMTAWKRSSIQEKRLKKCPIYVPLTHKSNKALWRGLTSLMPESAMMQDSSQVLTPGNILWIRYLLSSNGGCRIPKSIVICTHATGYEFSDLQRSSIKELVDDKLEFKGSLLTPEGADAVRLAKDCLIATEKAVIALGMLAERIELAAGLDEQLASKPRECAESEAYYELDSAFRTWLLNLDTTNLRLQERAWHVQASRIISSIAKELVANAGTAAILGRSIKDRSNRSGNKEYWLSAGKAEVWFQRDMKKALPASYESADESEVLHNGLS